MAIERRDTERTRRISDRLFQAMFMVMDEGAVALNKSGDIVAVNPAAENILGLSAEALIGRSSTDLARALRFIREDETPFPLELDPTTLALQTGEPQRSVLMGVHRPDGWLAWISVNAHPLPSDDESGPYGVITTFRDVTERKRAEDALLFVAQRGWMASHEKFFDALVKYLAKTLGVDHVLISILTEAPDIAETVALYARGAVVPNLRYSLKGAPCEEVMGRKSCFYPQGIQQLYPDAALLAEMGAESYSGLPLWDSAGQPIGLIAVLDSKPLRDEALVSQVLQFVAARAAAELERERSDRSLRQSEREFRSLADNIPDRVVRHDRQGRVRYVNPALLASIPPEFSVVIGESLVETFPGNAAKADLHRRIMRVIETGAPADVAFQLPNLCGEMRLHEVRYVAERDSNGEIVGVLGIGRDITEYKRMEDDIRRREWEFRSLAENMPDNVIRHDRQARVQYMNPALIASIAPDFLPVLGEAVTQTYPGNEGAASCERLVEQVIATGAPAEIEFEMPNPQGEMRRNHVRYVAERDSSGDIIGVLGIGRDITERRASELHLRQALEFNEGVINAIPDLLFEMDRDGTYLNVWAHNPELLVAQREALLGKRVFDVLAPDAAEVAVSAAREADEKGTSFGKVYRVDLPQGERWFELSVSKKPGSDMPGRFIALSRDITGRKRMEDDIRRRELEFRSLAENMPDYVIRYDRQARVLYMNPAIMDILAPGVRPVLGESPIETHPGNDGVASYQRIVEQVIATGTPAEWEFQIPTSHGEMRIHHARYVAECDSNGEIVGVLAIGRDVTERKRMEDGIRRRELEFRSLAENMPDNVVRYDLQARAVYMNPAILANVAPRFRPVLGEAPMETYPGEGGAEAHQRMVEQVIATGLPAEWEFETQDTHGQPRIHHARYVAERDSNGEIVGVLALGRDITERKRAEEYEQFRSRTLELLAGGAPLHDVLEGIVRGVEQLKPDMICSILLLDRQGKRLGEGVAPSLPDFYTAAVDGIEIGVGVGCCGTAAATGQRVITDDITTHPYWAPYKELVTKAGLGACWSEPIRASSGQVLGTFAAYHREAHSPTAFDLALIEKSTHLVSIAIERKRAEEALRASEREFRLLADSLPDNVVRHDRQARAQYMNPALIATIAPEALPVLGKSPIESHPDNDKAANHQRMIERVIATGMSAELEFEFPNPRGEMRVHYLNYVAARDDSGEIVGALGIGRDITERRASERHLREALEFTQGVINAIPDLLFEADQNGTCLNVWARTPELLAMHKEALLGKRLSDMVAPDTAEDALAALREADEKGLSFGKVLRVVIPQGERWFELSVSKKPGSDLPGRFIVLARDITGRKRMEDDIRRREREFRSLAENMPDNVVRYDRQAKVQYFNPALRASVAPELMPVLGQSAAESFPRTDSLMTYHLAIERVIATGIPFELEFQVPNPQGEIRDHQAHIGAERDANGDIIGALAIGRDVTERNRMEQAVAAREQEFRSLAENSRDRIIRYDRDGRVRYLNAQLLALFGMRETDIIGKRTREVWPDGCYGEIERACVHAVEAGEATTVELEIPDATGALRFHQIHIVPERDSAGQIIGSLGFGRDITAIREAERTLRHFIENLPGLAFTFRISPDGRAGFPYVSPAIKELYGLDPDDVKDDMAPLHRLAHPEDRPRIEAAIAESAQTMAPFRVEYRVCRPGQPERWLDQRSVPEREAGGSIIWYGIMLDITERKLAEEYEQFRSRTLELVSGGAPLPALLEGIVRGVEQLKPDMICNIVLLDSQGKRFRKGIGPSLPDSYNAGLDGLEIGIGVGSCGTAAATGERVIVEDIMTHPYWAPYKEIAAGAGLAACWSEPIRSSSGQVLGTFAAYHRQAHSPTAFDIALIEKSTHLASIAIERRRAEEALRASELEFRTLAENLPDFLVRYDREGRRTYLNPTMERVLAVPAEQMLGKTLPETNPTGMFMPETYQRALEHTLATGERSEFEMQLPLPDGSTLTGQCFMVAERDADGRISGAIAVTRDMTERTRNEAELERHRHHLEKLVENRTLALSAAKEAAEAATRAKSHFLAAASHDLRQPLQAIRLFNDTLGMSGLNKQQKEIADALSRSVRSLGELLNDLLDLSRLDAGTIEPRPAAIQATAMLVAIGDEFHAVCQEKNLELRLVCARQGLALFSDENLLLALVRNLVSNAVKYTRHGGVLVGIRRRGGRALIQVWDTGIGIPAEQKDSIFEEYFQIGNPARDRAKGVGLGLAIVRRLSKLLDAGVYVRSREGKGSVFEISVPLGDEPDTPASPRQAHGTPQTAARSRLAGRRIVIIEDDEIAGDAVKLALEMEGAEVVLFDRPEDALRSAEAMGADCYLSDYRLPGMNGLQLLEALEKKAAAPIEAVLLTGNVSPEQLAVLRSSPWKVILKPAALAELLSALDGREVRH